MSWTEEELNDLTEHASNLMKRSEICIIMGLDSAEFETELMDPDSPVYQAYYKGLLLTKSEIHKSVITLAKSGSSPAQTMVGKYLMDVESEQYE